MTAALCLHRAVNLGIAVSLGADGLIVPVIKHAEGLNLLGLARAVNDLADRARHKQLKPDDVQGGTFTITNHGTCGIIVRHTRDQSAAVRYTWRGDDSEARGRRDARRC